MTHTITTGLDLWTFQAAGTHVYVTQKRGSVVMTKCDYTTDEARELWVLLLKAGGHHLLCEAK